MSAMADFEKLISGSKSVLLAVAFVAILLYHYYVSPRQATSKANLPLPPGPKGLPILGMTAEVLAPPKKHAALFEDWDRQHGANGILCIPTLFRKQIIISDAKAAQVLLEKRGQLYSERAPNHYFDILTANGFNLVAMAKGPNIEKVRRLLHEEISPKSVIQWRALQASNAYHLALQLIRMDGETTVADVIDKTQKQLTLRTICGQLSVERLEDITRTEAELDNMPTPAIAPLLDLFPSMQSIPEWAPGGGYKRIARKYRNTAKGLWDRIRDEVKANAANSTSPSSLWGNICKTDAFRRYGFSEDDTSYIMGHQLGSNFVPLCILQVFFVAMLRFPDVLRKAQEEIDRVVGRDRLPNEDDEQSLPYIRALQCELLRWRPVVPLVQPHLASQDDEYEGYRIPKGALVWANLAAMSRNPETYPDPDQLKPERYLNPDGTFARKEEISIFGYGKRRCPGAYLASPILFLNIATLVWALDIGLHGGATLPSDDVEDWLTYITFVYPKPFKAKITPREATVLSLLQEGAAGWTD